MILTADRIKKELARLERNKDRRHAREKQKGIFRGSTEREITAASPSATPAPSVEKPTGTTRKCANCGQAGHIKTNKKYLFPLLPVNQRQRQYEGSVASSSQARDLNLFIYLSFYIITLMLTLTLQALSYAEWHDEARR